MDSKTFNLKLNDLKDLKLPKAEKQKSLAILFCAPEVFKKKEIIEKFIEKNDHVQLIGCSSSGEIFDDQLIDESIVLAHLSFQSVQIETFRIEVTEPNKSHSVGEELADFFNSKPNLKSLFVLSEGTGVNGSQLVAGINSQIKENIICTGGLAGDGDRFEKTWVIDSDGCHNNAIVAAGFYGDNLIYNSGSYGGWDVFGPERQITKSAGNVLYEIDGEPALDLYKRYLGHMAYKLPSSALQFPLQIQPDKEKDIYLVRTILSIDEQEKTLTFAGDIQEGSKARLMRTNFDRLIEGSARSAQMANHEVSKDEKVLSIVISCAGRRWVLGERCEEEIGAALAVFPNKTGQVGFYSYGEIAPTKFHSCSELLNQSMTITTIGEKCA